MRVKVLLIILFIAIVAGCKASNYTRDFKFDDVYSIDEIERETTEPEDAFQDARQLEIRFNDVTLRQAVDELNRLETEYTVYLAVSAPGSSSRNESDFFFVSTSGAPLETASDARLETYSDVASGTTSGVMQSRNVPPLESSTDMSSAESASEESSKVQTAPYATKYGSQLGAFGGGQSSLNDMQSGAGLGFGSARRFIPSSSLSDSAKGKDSVEDKKISGLFTGTVRDIVCELSSLYGLDYEEFGTKLYIGGDLSNYVVNVVCETSLDDEAVRRIAETTRVQIIKTSNKLLITGRTRGVRRAYELLEQLSEVPRSYNVDLIFIDIYESQLADLRAKVEVQSVNLLQKGLSIWDVFKATGAIDMTCLKAYNYTDQELYCTDGKKVALQIGTEFQREKRAITDQGTSTVLGYEKERDGVIMEIKPLRSVGSAVSMEIQYENGTFLNSDYSKYNTKLQYDSVTFTQNKIYYLTCVDEQVKSKKKVFVGLTNEQSHRVTTIWLCVRPVVAKRDKNNNI